MCMLPVDNIVIHDVYPDTNGSKMMITKILHIYYHLSQFYSATVYMSTIIVIYHNGNLEL